MLFTNSLGISFAVRIEEVLAALLPCRLELRRCDVPVGPAFLGDRTQILAEFFHGRATQGKRSNLRVLQTGRSVSQEAG